MKWLKRIGKGLLVLVGIVGLFLLVQYTWTGNPAEVPWPEKQTILAHRGVHLNYQKGVYDVKTGCEAQHIFPPTHAYLGNTLRSIEAAFAFGADMVEIDLRKTADRNLMVFHDYALDCRTDGEGLLRQHTTSALQQLDIGYGYTPDGGQTFPFRGKGKGLMPSLTQVLDRFPEQAFLLDHKDWDTESLQNLMTMLADYPAAQRDRLWLWSNPVHQQQMQDRYPEVQALFFTRKEAKEVFGRFVLSFGSWDIPAAYRGRVMAIPAEYIPYLWGWPYRFLDAVHAQGVLLYVFVDTEAEAEAFKAIPVDGYITDYIEVVGPVLRENMPHN